MKRKLNVARTSVQIQQLQPCQPTPTLILSLIFAKTVKTNKWEIRQIITTISELRRNKKKKEDDNDNDNDNDSDGEQDQVDHSSEGDGDGDDDGDDDGDGDTKQYLYTRFTEVEDTLLWKQQSKKRISNYDLEEHVFKQTRTHLQIKNRWCREGFKKYVAKNYSVNAYSNLLIRWKELEKY